MIATPSTTDSDRSPEPSAYLELLKMDVIGRVRVPPERRESILDIFEQSGMSGQAFASKWGLKYPTFATWVQKRRRERDQYPKAREAPLPKALSLVEAVIVEDVPSGALLEVEAPGGIKLRLSRREDIALAVELLKALRSC